MYIVNDNGAEQVIQFGVENWWITEYVSLKSGRPSLFNIQAVEDSEIIALERREEDELFAKVPQLERYFRLVLEKAYSAQLMRINFIFNMSAEERYRYFTSRNPEFVQRVPQYVLASYLGFTPEFMSKLRAKKE
jgi:CRP/FNR family transcriptional regulator